MKKILIVDDEPDFRFCVTAMLKRAGYRVTEAGDGEEALEIIIKEQKRCDSFDLLILDLRMPGISGIDLIDRLEKNGITVPTLIVSGYYDDKMVNELRDKGFSEILYKPFTHQEFTDRVKAILEEKNMKLIKQNIE